MVGYKLNKNKVVIIYSTIELVNGNSAGSARVMNYARALSSSCDVILLTFLRLKGISLVDLKEIEPGIYTVGDKLNSNKIVSKLLYYFKVFYFLRSIANFLKGVGESKQKTLLFYPSTETFIDYLSVVYLIQYQRYKVIYEANEVRKYSIDFEINPSTLNSKFQRLKYGYSEKLTKYFSGVICISTSIEKYFKKYNQHTIRIPILSNLNKIDNIDKIKFEIGDIFKIGFFGSVNYYKENLNQFLKSLQILKSKNPTIKFKVEFYGSIDKISKMQLTNSIVELKLEDEVFYCGKLNQNEVINFMHKCHLLILPRGASLQNHYGFSTKLSEYLVSGVPCLVTNVSDNALYIKDNDNGFIVEPDNLEAFVNKLIFIVENYNEFYKKIVKSSFMTVEKHFKFSNYRKTLLKFICSKE